MREPPFFRIHSQDYFTDIAYPHDHHQCKDLDKLVIEETKTWVAYLYPLDLGDR